jgi:hypothetical protein
MKRAGRWAVVYVLCVAVSACAGAPGEKPQAGSERSVASGAPVAAVAASATPPGATATLATAKPSPAAAAAVSPGASVNRSNAKPPPGFKARRRDGELVYCRTVQSTGSHFPEEQCWPPEKVWAALERQRESSQRLLEQPRGCRGADCATGTPTGP